MSAYVPILAADPSRLGGLAATTDAVKARLTPLFDVAVPPADAGASAPGDERATDCLNECGDEAYLSGVVRGVAQAFGTRPALVDCRDASANDEAGCQRPDCGRTADGRVHLAWLLDEARAHGLTLVPVTGLRRPAAYQLAVADALNVDGRGVGLRLRRPDFLDAGALVPRVLGLLDALDTAPEHVDLVVDFGAVRPYHLARVEAVAREVLPRLTRAGAWRTLTIAAATQLPADRHDRAGARRPRAVPRADWLLWQALTAPGEEGEDSCGAVPEAREAAEAAAAALRAYARTGTLRFGDYGPILYGPARPRAGDAHDWVGYAHGDEWLVRDLVTARRWGEAGRVAVRVLRADRPAYRLERPGVAHANGHASGHANGHAATGHPVTGHPLNGHAGNGHPRGRPPVEAAHLATVRSIPALVAEALVTEGGAGARSAEDAASRAAAVTHHLTVAVEQLALAATADP